MSILKSTPSALFVTWLLVCATAWAESEWRTVVANHCLECHDSGVKKGGIDLDSILDQKVADHSPTWELVLRQIQARQMPPLDEERPEEADYAIVGNALITALDEAGAEKPAPGRTDTVRRLTRYEYQSAIRDLLSLEVNSADWLPKDEDSHGFDNVTVSDLSPSLLERYITAAQDISRLAVGGKALAAEGHTFQVRPDVTQENHLDGLPLGTRGGTMIKHHFPRSGTYKLRILLTRDRNEHVEGLKGRHQLFVLLNKREVVSFEVKPPQNRADHTQVDAHLQAELEIPAGPQTLAVTFGDQEHPVDDTLRQPYESRFNYHRHPRQSPAIYQITLTGPFEDLGPGTTPSRDRTFGANKIVSPEEEANAAQSILSQLMRQAYRRPVNEADLERSLAFYGEARAAGGDFEVGIQMALSSILANRDFLFRVEHQPKDVLPGTPYPVSNLDLASRLSFFLWSSLPDEELLQLAEEGHLREPKVLAEQTRRMLQDERAQALVDNFADQWLYLRNLESVSPDGRLFPDFDDNLRQALRKETERLFGVVLTENRSVLEMLQSDQTYLNERLAKHYGIAHVYGDRFRHVALNPEDKRGGLLRQGSILTVTSYATRTSPVIRGNWILENLLGTAPPPPPPNVPALEENSVAADLPIRERLAAHREQAACASCHKVIDPVGFCLENYNAIGQWRLLDEEKPVDALGGLPNGSQFVGVQGLEQALRDDPEAFVRTLTEKLLTYALGRGIEPKDGPAVRSILREAEANDYRFHDLLTAITQSVPFTMRMSE